MLATTFTVVALTQALTLASAHDKRASHHVPYAEFARQDAPASGDASASPTYSLHSTNPTAMPLSEFTGGATSVPSATYSTHSAGETPADIPSAPGLPDIAGLDPSTRYPALDKTPPTDSDEVKQWLQEVADSGVNIPDYSANVAGGCEANAEAAADDSRCWWTCSGCVRDTDVEDCPEEKSWCVTFDDGPSDPTPNLMEYLNQESLKATFFVVGSRVVSTPDLLRAQYMAGHQIASHTWSHAELTTLSNEQIVAELGWTRQAIREVLGVSPNMMRPPYGDIDDRVRAISQALGMTPVMWSRISATATFDTHDFDIHSQTFTVQQVIDSWGEIMGNASTMDKGFITLSHDLWPEAVDVNTGYIIPDAIAQGFKLHPVISGLNQPIGNAYIETNDNGTNPPAASGSAVVTLSSGAPGSDPTSGSGGDSAGDNGGDSGSDGGDGAVAIASVGISALLAIGASFALLL